MIISEKKLLPLKYLNYIYLAIKLLSYAVILFVILFFVNDCYQLYLKENNLVQIAKLNSKTTAHIDIFLEHVLWSVIFSLLKIFACVLSVLLTKYILFHIPLTSSYLIFLDKTHQISPILGRYLTYHFRRHTSINFSTLVFLNQEAEYENYIISIHKKKNKFDYFLKKYDTHYTHDIEHH